MTLRKGQKLCIWIIKQGFQNKNVHTKLFNMTDREFEQVMRMTDKDVVELVNDI
jgi:hypothetical protein